MVDVRNAQRGATVNKRRMNRTGYYTSIILNVLIAHVLAIQMKNKNTI